MTCQMRIIDTLNVFISIALCREQTHIQQILVWIFHFLFTHTHKHMPRTNFFFVRTVKMTVRQ